MKLAASFAECSDPFADVVVTDHHRPELGVMLRDVLAGEVNWVGVMGSPRHPAPHIPALAAMGVPAADIARVHRPIGLNIESRRRPRSRSPRLPASSPSTTAARADSPFLADRGCPGRRRAPGETAG